MMCWRCFWSAVIGGLTVFVALFLVAMWNAAMADHHYTSPHSWISQKSNGQYNCCGPGDIAEIPHWEAAGAGVGDTVAAEFPSHGQQSVIVKKVYPTQDGKAYITYYGCLFKSFGI